MSDYHPKAAGKVNIDLGGIGVGATFVGAGLLTPDFPDESMVSAWPVRPDPVF